MTINTKLVFGIKNISEAVKVESTITIRRREYEDSLIVVKFPNKSVSLDMSTFTWTVLQIRYCHTKADLHPDVN